MILTSAVFADTVTVLETPAGIYVAVPAKLAVDENTGEAYIKVFLRFASVWH